MQITRACLIIYHTLGSETFLNYSVLKQILVRYLTIHTMVCVCAYIYIYIYICM